MRVFICTIGGDVKWHTYHLVSPEPRPPKEEMEARLKALVAREFCVPRWEEVRKANLLGNTLMAPQLENINGETQAFDAYFAFHPQQVFILSEIELVLPGSVKGANAEWSSNSVQFPRLISEAAQAGLFDHAGVRSLSQRMQVVPEKIQELINRAGVAAEKDRMEILGEIFV